MWLASWLAVASAYDVSEITFGWQADALDHPFELATAGFPSALGTEAAIEDAFIDGLQTWDDADAGVTLSYQGRFVGSHAANDGQLSASYSTDVAADFTLATAFSWGTTDGHTVDCDIVFYGANSFGGPIAWSLGTSGGVDFVDATAHETGHCLGLRHSADLGAQMAPDLRGVRGLTDDDRDGLQSIFGHCPDGDGDGFDTCSDCDDSNVLIHPNAIERCDGVDNDCDGVVDAVLTASPSFGTANHTIDRSGWGNAYTVTTDTVLHRFAQYLTLDSDARVTWSVLREGASGTWERLVTHTEASSAGTGWFESPRIDLPLDAGERYLLVAGIEAMGTFHYSLGLGASANGLTPQGTVVASWVPANDHSGAADPTFSTRQRVTVAIDDTSNPLCGSAPGTTPSGTGSGTSSCGSCVGPSLWTGPTQMSMWAGLFRR